MSPHLRAPTMSPNHTSKPWCRPLIGHVAALLFLLLIIGGLLFSSLSLIERRASENICFSKTCIEGAAHMFSALNTSADPCQDFFEFSCGKFRIYSSEHNHDVRNLAQMRLYRLLEDFLKTKDKLSDTPLQANMKRFYRSCGSYSKQRNVTSSIQRLYNMTSGILGTSNVELSNNALNKALEVLSRFRIFPFFTIRFAKDSSDIYVRISEGSLLIHGAKMLNSSELLLSLMCRANLSVELRDIFDFEHKLAQVSPEPDLRISRINLTLGDIENSFTEINLTEIIVSSLEHGGIHLQNDKMKKMRVIVHCFECVNQTLHLVRSTSLQKVTKYLELKLLDQLVLHIDPGSFRPDLPPGCLTELALHFREGLNTLAMELTQQDATEIRASIQGISSSIPRQKWMTLSMLIHFERRKSTFYLNLGGFKNFTDQNYLNKNFGKLSLKENDDYFTNILHLHEHQFSRVLNHMLDPYSYLDWGSLAVEMKAANSIVNLNIGAGFLLHPYYEPRRPRYLNIGSLGFILGHELAHSLQPSELVKEQSLGPDSEYIKELACLQNQYQAHSSGGLKIENIEASKLFENEADNLALQATYKAYLEYEEIYGEEQLLPGSHYNPHQLFFIAFAQTFCEDRAVEEMKKARNSSYSLARHRVNGALRNSNVFWKEFGCPQGSPMNPARKCRPWNID